MTQPYVTSVQEFQRLSELCEMLSTCRPMGSKTERAFRRQWIDTLPQAWYDFTQNIHVILPRTDGTASRVLWSSHTDTVHTRGGTQALMLDDTWIALHPKARANCLGADDTVGVWLMREMIRAGVPGHYVFHYGEERGGIGSSSIVQTSPELFAGIDYAIALDRGGTTDIITHQCAGRTASDNCAWTIAEQLVRVADYRPCDRGVYTDTAEYADIIGECTNISVGYEAQHSPYERTDYRHGLRLCEALCAFDETLLLCERIPGDLDTWSDESSTSALAMDREEEEYLDYMASLSESDRQVVRWLRGLD